MTPAQIHHARIMIEGGCSIEDAAATLGLRLHDAIYAVAPSLKANPKQQKRVQKLLLGTRLSRPILSADHRCNGTWAVVSFTSDAARPAA